MFILCCCCVIAKWMHVPAVEAGDSITCAVRSTREEQNVQRTEGNGPLYADRTVQFPHHDNLRCHDNSRCHHTVAAKSSPQSEVVTSSCYSFNKNHFRFVAPLNASAIMYSSHHAAKHSLRIFEDTESLRRNSGRSFMHKIPKHRKLPSMRLAAHAARGVFGSKFSLNRNFFC